MKKIIVFLLVMIMLVTSSACLDNTSNKESQGTLLVEGQTISCNATVYPEYAIVSLCDVISALGFELSWSSADSASFYCNNVKYEICISEKTLKMTGDDSNYLICAPGNKHFFCDVVDGVLMVDDNTVNALFDTFIEYPINISIDRDNNSVVITVLCC